MKRRKIGDEKCGVKNFLFLISNFLFFFSLTIAFMFFFAPEEVTAGQMDKQTSMQRMPKYSLGGSISLQYDDTLRKSGGDSSHTSLFTQNYRLNFQSYIISPKLMYYTITTGWNVATGSGGSDNSKTYGITTTFLPYRPFSFSLSALRTDGKEYEATNYGLSMIYQRKGKLKAPGRGMRSGKRQTNNNNNNNNNNNKNNNNNNNNNNNANTNANVNANLNIDYDSNSNSNSNSNTNSNAKKKIKDILKPNEEEGLFTSILPQTVLFDVNRNSYKFKNLKSEWDNAALRLKGNYGRTRYYWNFDYSNWKRDNSASNTGYGSNLTTSTNVSKLAWGFFNSFDNQFSYRKNGVTAYNINSTLSGATKKWGYSLNLYYNATSDSADSKEFNFSANITRRDSATFVYKGIKFDYSFSFGVARSRKSTEMFAGTTLTAYKRFGASTDWTSALSILGGSRSGLGFDFSTGISYTFRPRKGYTVSVEIDPEKKLLKSNTFKPQVYGWDYSIRTAYTFGASRSTMLMRGFSSGAAVARGSSKISTSHRGDLNIFVSLRGINLTSDAALTYVPDSGKSFSWNNALYTMVMRKIGVSIGTGMTVAMPEQGTRTTTYTAYNLLTYNIWRTGSFRLSSRYTKVMPDNSTSLEIAPSVSWIWRSLYMNLEVTLKKDKTNSGSAVTERRIMFRVTRPFRIL